MNHRQSTLTHCCVASVLIFVLGTSTATAKEAAHVHGLMRMNVAVQAQSLTVQIEAPLDSLLGFEHAPRTSAQRTAADALVKRLNEDQTLVRPAASAACKLIKTTVDAASLMPADKSAALKKDADAHADVDIAYEFKCSAPDKLDSVTLGLFDAFKRLQKIEAQVATAQGQSKQTLTRAQPVLKLKR